MIDVLSYATEHLPGVEIRVAHIGDEWGITVWDEEGRPTIYLAFDLGPVARLCTLAHEIKHVEAGTPCKAYCPEDEARVRQDTARWLLPDTGEVTAALAALSLNAAAEMLGVLPVVLLDRLDTLTSTETQAAQRQLAITGVVGAGCSYGQRRRDEHPAPACRRRAARS